MFVKITASGRKLLKDVDLDIEKGRAAVAKRLATEAAGGFRRRRAPEQRGAPRQRLDTGIETGSRYRRGLLPRRFRWRGGCDLE